MGGEIVAIFRQIHTTFWEDAYIEELDPLGKLFYLYVLTNSKTSICGVFELTVKKAAWDTGLTIEQVKQYINQLIKDHKIKYDVQNKEVLVINWLKYQGHLKSEKTAMSVDKELLEIKTSEFESEVIMTCQGLGYPIKTKLNADDTVSIPYTDGIDTVPIPYAYNKNKNKNKNKNNNKNKKEKENKSNGADAPKAPPAPANKSTKPYDIYQEEFGVLSPMISEDLEHWVEQVGEDMVIEAMKRSSLDKKGYRYAVGIIRSWIKNGIKTIEDAKAEQVQFENRMSNSSFQGKKQGRVEPMPDWAKEDYDSLYSDVSSQEDNPSEELNGVDSEQAESLKKRIANLNKLKEGRP